MDAMTDDDEDAKAKRKAATLAGLKKRGEEGELEREIVSGRGTSNTIDAGGSGGTKNNNYQRPSLKIRDTPASPSPSPSPSPGVEQAAALRKPPVATPASPAPSPAASASSWDTMPMSELAKETGLAARSAYNRRKQKGEK